MTKKTFYAVLDSRSLVEGQLMEFSLIIMDRVGEFYNAISVFIGDVNSISYSNIEKKILNEYKKMYSREDVINIRAASVNRWLDQTYGKYAPILIGPRLAHQLKVCQEFGIIFSNFKKIECLSEKSQVFLEKSKTFRSLACKYEYLSNLIICDSKLTQRVDYIRAFLVTGVGNGVPATGYRDVRDLWSRLLVSIEGKIKPIIDEDRALKVAALL